MSTNNKKGLGRGFESLIPTDLLDESFDITAAQDEQISDLRHIKLSEISPDKDQPRKSFDQEELEELAASIKEHGVLQPIVVTPYEHGYQIIAGERRYRAAQLAGLEKIPALVRTLSGQHKLEISIIENVQRKDLNVLELATAYQKLYNQFNLTMEQIAEKVGKKSHTHVSNIMRMLKMPEIALKALAENKMSEGQAKSILSLSHEEIERIVPIIVKEGWSVHRLEQYVADLKKGRVPAVASKYLEGSSGAYQKQIEKFSKYFSTDINIRSTAKGSGRIVIKFKDEQDLKRIEKLLKN